MQRCKTVKKLLYLQKELEKKDLNTAIHCNEVGKICGLITEEMIKRTKDITFSVFDAQVAGDLHDIGKLRMNDNILKGTQTIPSPKDNLEIRRHPVESFNILNEMGFDNQIATIILSHHERWDGSGYPNGLKGEEIPILASIVGIADTFSALTQKRPYKESRKKEEAIKIMEKEKYLFCPEIFEIFLFLVKDLIFIL